MRVIIPGGTGLIGRSLVALLAGDDYEIIVVSRQPILAAQKFRQQGLTSVQVVEWDAQTAHGWGALINKDSAIINLAGTSPAHWRWTRAYRARILESRLHAGRAIMQAMERYGSPAVLVQASASGYYGDRGRELLTEASSPGQGFRAKVCQEWEASTADAQIRRCLIRTGLVLDCHEGAFPPLLHFARLFGRQVGDGQQWIPWIHKADVARAIQFLLQHQELVGPFNLCAPQAVTNREFVSIVRQMLKRRPLFPLPAFVLRALLGELSTVVLDSQHLLPQYLTEANFQFAYPLLEQALHHLLRETSLRI
ncbi:MAG TPA: TIGR01777 family oxidoreductase [Ktedonobacteraceae bacterium]|nr:TIGR01777 family oxidoreductase [Ktedonobacteraceae bacterium]